jgi:hypothetical protein
MKTKLFILLPLVVIGFAAIAPSAFAATTVQSVKLTGPNIITVMYSEPVYTSPSDYFDFTGSYAGNTVTAVSGSGTATITLTLENSVAGGATGYLTIGTNVQDVSDQQYFGGATWNIVGSIGPAITGFGLSSNDGNGSFAGTNNTLTATFNTNEQVNVLDMNIDGHSVSVSGSGTGPYTANYTMQSGDSMEMIPVTFTIEDNNNNESNISFSYTSNGTVSSNTGNAAISSITSNANTAGVLNVGDSITFTLTPAVAEPNGHVTGSYNGVPLSWVTTNNGLNYVATYILAAGQSSQSTPLQISGVTLTDQYGNVSAPASGYDVQRSLSISGYTTAASVSQVTPVPVTTTSATPSYTFYTNQPGTIVYAGGCSSPTDSAVIGSNTITFNALPNGTYSSCSIAIVNGSGIQSGALTISSFTVDAPTTAAATNTNSSVTASQLASLESQLTALEAQAAGNTAPSGNLDGSAGFDFTEFLGVGSQNAQVTALQERLTADGYFTGPVTGYYGALTQAAVKKYQAANDINTYGYVGPGTRAALNAGK